MALTQKEINKAAVIAAVLIKDKSKSELEVMLEQIGEGERRAEFVLDLRSELAQAANKSIDEVSLDFAREIASRMYNTIVFRLSVDIST